MGVVVRGEEMVSGRSGMEAVKRIMRLRGGKERGRGEESGEAIVGGSLNQLCGSTYKCQG